MDWVTAGLLYAFFNSVVIFTNEKFKMDPAVLGMYRGFGSFLLILPFALFTSFPHGWVLWTFAIVQGLLVGYFDYKLFSASARFGAGGTSMMTVLAIILTIFLWWFVDFQRLWDLMHEPMIFLAIGLSMLGCLAGYIRLVGSQMTRELFFFMLPAVIVLAVMTLNSKFLSGRAPLGEITIFYIVIIGLVGGLYNLGLYWRRTRNPGAIKLWREIRKPNYLRGGSLMVVCSMLLMATKTDAMLHIPNPAYLNTLALTSPLWIILINRFEKIHTRISVTAAIFTLACIASLVYFSNLPLAAVPY